MTGKKAWRILRKILIGAFLGAMGLQIIFGVLWLCLNLGAGQMSSMSVDYLKNAETLQFDEYSGVIYVLLVALMLGVEKVTGISCGLLLSVIQILLTFIGGCYFFRCVRKDGKKCFELKNVLGSLYLLTVPLLLQVHVTIGTESLFVTAFLFLLGLCKRWSEEGSWKDLVGVLCVLAFSALMNGAYLAFGMIPVLFAVVISVKRKKTGFSKVLLVLGVALVLVFTNHMVLEPAEGKIQRTVSGALVSRMVWPWFEHNYYFWPEEIKTVMPEELARNISLESENVARVFGPLVEQAYGREKAGELFWDMAKNSLQVRTREVLEGALEDFKAYLCVPYSLFGQLDGKGSYSYSGRNYKQLLGENPEFAAVYMRGSLAFADVAIACGAVLLLIIVFEKVRNKKRTWEKTGLFMVPALVVLGQALWYTVAGAGMMDYINVSVATMIWYMVPVWVLKNLIKSDV